MIIKAGAVVLSAKNMAKVALLYRGEQKDWSFPKGHIESGENPSEAMIREIKEETGLNIKIIKELPDYLYSNKMEGDIVTKMFLVRSEDDSKHKLEFKKDDIQWISYDKVVEKLIYDNLKDYFNLVLPIIKKEIDF